MKDYRRNDTVNYAKKWALYRNSNYLNFDNIGGDCTNFASQCIFAGAKIMNYTKDIGWYYNSANDRAAPWSDANYLNIFLKNNNGAGPTAKVVSKDKLEIGDLVQLNNGKKFYHSLIVTEISGDDILICAHTHDVYMIPLESYRPKKFEYIHIIGVNEY